LQDYDAEGEYIRTWCPELAALPVPKLFEPWLLTPEEQQRYGVRIGTDYPAPLTPQGSSAYSSGTGHA
jgi:deoxyribodipyrimidine photo-lyase